MATTNDLTTPVGKVRLYTTDVPVAGVAIFDDAAVGVFLDMNGGSVLLAAADALDTIATNEALVLKVIRSQDLQTDGAKLSAELRARADGLRDRARDSSLGADDSVFAVVGGFGWNAYASPEAAERAVTRAAVSDAEHDRFDL